MASMEPTKQELEDMETIGEFCECADLEDDGDVTENPPGCPS